MQSRARANPSPPGHRAPRTARGCLVVVVGPEQWGPDLLLTPVRRRTLHVHSLEFPRILTTRRNGSPDVELPVTRDSFRRIAAEGGFLTSWRMGRHLFGVPSAVCDLVAGGNTVVLVAPAGAVPDLQKTAIELRVIQLKGDLDGIRAALTPQARLRRMMGSKLASRLEVRRAQPRTIEAVHSGDAPSIVRRLTDVLVSITEERQRCRPAKGGDRCTPAAPGSGRPPHLSVL
jgi:ribose 1,5-bisphosphokinase PhnN